MLCQAAEKTGDVVGGGTSTSAIPAGASGNDIKRGLDRGLQVGREKLQTMSSLGWTAKENEQVAAIWAHNDASIDKMVADVIEKVGDETVITIEDSRTTETVLDVMQGMQSDRVLSCPIP